MKIVKIIFACFILLISYNNVWGQKNVFLVEKKVGKLHVSVDLNNLSPNINDGVAYIHVYGGQAPYTFKWSKKQIPLNSDKGTGLTEGKYYTVCIRDAIGNCTKIKFKIPARSINEKLNSAFLPVVKAMDKILMTDIFADLHLYDPVIRDKNGKIVRWPNGDPRKKRIPFIVIWLILGATYFTIKMGFINIRGFWLAIEHVSGKYDDKRDPGEVSHFQALTTALSATVGLGNIAGVAIAISLGGPGATFWMILAGLLGMSSKFTECTLGVKYRDIDKNGIVAGGPMYYMSKALAKRNMKGLGKFLAILFSLLVIGGSFGGGNMFQANQSFKQLARVFPMFQDYGALYGVLLAILVGLVVIGGIKSIAKVTDKIVPFMAFLYVATALVIILININRTPEAIHLILSGAFKPAAIKGGIIGVLIVGFQRAAFSNEAGIGSAAIAHSAVKTKEPITEGLVALLEPFIDTVIICTMTALVIIYTGLYNAPSNIDGVVLTSKAFETVFPWFKYLLLLAVFLFAFSTMISWSYYGLNGFKFLVKKYIKNEKTIRLIYYSFFLFFIVLGAASELGAVVDFSDMMVLSMAFPNIFTLYILAGEVKKDLDRYLKKLKTEKQIQKAQRHQSNLQNS